MIYSIQRKLKLRRAAAAVEAAIVVPILVAFMAGIVDIGRLGKIADSVSNAARNGAQFGSTNSTYAADTTGIEAAAMTEMSGVPNGSTTNPTVTVTTVTSTTGSFTQEFIQVTVSYDMTGTTIFPTYFVVTNMTRTVQMPMMPQ